METSGRRMQILKILGRRRHETISNLAVEFDVSERTIRRDIDVLSLSEPIYTQSGRYGGGVYMLERYFPEKLFLTEKESEVVDKIKLCAEKCSACTLSAEEAESVFQMLSIYKVLKKEKSEKKI